MTLTPLADRWDSSGRIVTPMTSAPVPEDTEKSMRLDSLKLAKTKQLDALETDKLTADIESFVSNPGGFKGASVRKADFGTREFEFGGRKIFTYSADAEQQDRASFTKLNDSKSFAEILTTDLPSRLAVASRLWADGGDKAGAHAELAAVDSFVKDNYETLATLTKYQGTNPLAANVAKQASGFISGAYKLPFATMDRDPEIRAKSALKTATDTGLSGAAADLFVRKENGDAEAAALWGSLGAPSLDHKPGATGKGASPQEARAAATGANITDIVDYSEYAAKSLPALRASLGEETFGMFSPSERASLVRESYTAGGAGAGQVLLDLAVGASSRLVGQEKVDAFKSAVSAGSTALQSWGADDSDPARRTQGVKVLKALSDLPRGGMAAGKQQISDTLKAVARDTATYRNMGVALDDSTAETYAKVLYKRAFSPSEVLTGEEGRVSSVMNSAFATARNIIVGGGFTDTGKQPEAKGEFDLLAGVAKEHVQGAAAAAIANKTDLGTEMLNRSASLSQALQALGVSDPVEADNGARLLAQVLSGGKEVDLTTLTAALKNHSVVQPLLATAEEKAGVPASKSVLLPTAAEGAEALRQTALTRSVDKLKQFDASRGVTRPAAELEKAAAMGLEEDTDLRLFQGLLGNIVGTDETGALTGSEADRPALRAAFSKEISKVAPRVFFEMSPMFRYLYDEVPVSGLSAPEVRESAIQKVLDAYASETALGSSISDKAALRSLAEDRVTRTIRNIEQSAKEAGAELDLPAKQTIEKTQPVGASFSTIAESVARRPHVGRVFGGLIGYATEEDTSEKVADSLFSAFATGVKRSSPGELSFASDVKGALLSSVNQPKPGAAPITSLSTPEGSEYRIDLARAGGSEKVLSGYKALKAVSDRLGKPIQNASVRQLVLEDLPQLMRDMPRSAQLRGRRISVKMAYEGKSTDEIMEAFEASFTAEEKRAAAAKAAADALKAAGDGMLALQRDSGAAETVVDQK